MTKGGFFVENTLRRIVDADRASRLSVEKASLSVCENPDVK